MNKASLSIIASLLALGAAKSVGSRSFWNEWTLKGRDWQKAFCHDGLPTFDSIGDISYIENTFLDMGYVKDTLSPDILYTHILLRDFEFLKTSSMYNPNPESENFFQLYKRLSEEDIPVFIIGLNRLSDRGSDFSKYINVLSATTNGHLNGEDSTFDAWRPYILGNERLKKLHYHVYTVEVNAIDVGIPLNHRITYVIGFKAVKKKYIKQPIVNLSIDIDSFGSDIDPDDVIGVANKDIAFKISQDEMNRLLSTNANPKIFQADSDEIIRIPIDYEKRGKRTATYVRDLSGFRTLSKDELIYLFDVRYINTKESKSAFMRNIVRFSFTRGLEQILQEISDLLSCEKLGNEEVVRFFEDYNKPRFVSKVKEPITIGGMFSGIGGFEYGLSRGFAYRGIPTKVLWDYEVNSFAQGIFSSHFPNAKALGDITLHNIPEGVDIITMGFPCPDVSMAGLRKGIKQGTRSGLFIPAFKKCMQLNPKMIIMENVDGILKKNKQTGVAPIDVVKKYFVDAGWNLEWLVVSAKEFGALHVRRRWFCVAYKQGSYSNVMVRNLEEWNGIGNYPKYGSVINGKIYLSTPRSYFDAGIRSKVQLPTPLAVDWEKRPTGSLRMRLQEGASRSAGRDRKYPQSLPPGYEWVQRGGKWVSSRINGWNEVINPQYVEWMMGFPAGWIYGQNGGFDINSWSSGEEPDQLISRQIIRDTKVFRALGNAIVPQIPEFIAYAYLWDKLK